MLVKECMTKNVELGNPNMSLADAAKKMKEGNFGVLPIGDGDRLVGMITDRDITIRAVAAEKDSKKIKVNDVMTKNVLYCFDDETLDAVTENLGANKIRRLPVLNRQKRLVGILSLSDLARARVDPRKVEKAIISIAEHKTDRSQPRASA